MRFSRDGLKGRERFLSMEFVKRLDTEKEGIDPFTTGTADIPKAFRVGECKELSPERTEFQVLIFWRDDTRSEEKKISVEVARIGDEWRLDKVTR